MIASERFKGIVPALGLSSARSFVDLRTVSLQRAFLLLGSSIRVWSRQNCESVKKRTLTCRPSWRGIRICLLGELNFCCSSEIDGEARLRDASVCACACNGTSPLTVVEVESQNASH